jgi:peptide/nickel transport system substrate-binding protein
MTRVDDEAAVSPAGASASQVSRREFIRLAAAGLCAGTMQSVSASQSPRRRGGFARFSCSGTTNDSLDPRINTSEFVQVVFYGAVSNALCEFDAQGRLVGDLAESFEMADRGRKWIFRLRKGVTFHDGKDLTAADIIATFRHHMGADSISGARTFVETISDIRADGPHTVVFTLDSGSVDFPDQVTDTFFPILPARNGRADWASGIRTGPFILEDWKPGVSASLKRNPNYHKPGMPFLDAIEFTVINDVPSRMNALTAGEIDLICSRSDLHVIDLILGRNPHVRFSAVPGNFCFSMPMNVTVPPFDNRDVRHAIKWSLNRSEVAKQIFRGYAQPGNDNLISPMQRYAIQPQPVFHFDPDRVRYHLRRAGLKSLRVGLSMSDAVINGAVDAAIMLKEYARQCDIDIDVTREPVDGYWDNVWMKKQWTGSNQFGSSTIDREFTTASAADSPWNATRWNNRRFNELLVAARAELDSDERSRMYAEMQKLQHDEDGNVVLLFADFVYAYLDRLDHGTIGQKAPADNYRIAERWWAR